MGQEIQSYYGQKVFAGNSGPEYRGNTEEQELYSIKRGMIRVWPRRTFRLLHVLLALVSLSSSQQQIFTLGTASLGFT